MTTSNDQRSYAEVRSLICNGDLLTFSKNAQSSLWHRFTTRVLRSPYYHCGLAVWMTSDNGTRRLFICEAGTSRRILLLSAYTGLDFDVIGCPADFNKFEDSLLERVGVERYSIITYIAVGLRFLIGLPTKDPSGEICSEMVQKAYRKGGFYLPRTIMSPGELHAYVLERGAKLKFIVRG